MATELAVEANTGWLERHLGGIVVMLVLLVLLILLVLAVFGRVPGYVPLLYSVACLLGYISFRAVHFMAADHF